MASAASTIVANMIATSRAVCTRANGEGPGTKVWRRGAGGGVLVARVGGGRAPPRFGLEPPRDEQPQTEPHQHDQDDSPDQLRERELPAKEDPHDDAELEDEVR